MLVRVLLTFELMELNHSWWANNRIHCRKRPVWNQYLKMARSLVCHLWCYFIDAVFLSNLFKHFSRCHSMIQVICTRTGNTQSTCQTLKFQFQQQATPFSLLHAQHSPCVAHEMSWGGPGAKCLGPVEWPSLGERCASGGLYSALNIRESLFS